jgi:hypothetical protein
VAVEVRDVGRTKEIVKVTTCGLVVDQGYSGHKGKKGARMRRRRVIVEGKDDAVCHCVLEEEGGWEMLRRRRGWGKHARREREELEDNQRGDR